MQEGGHIAGWLVDGEVKEQFLEKLRSYEEQMTEKYKDLSDDPMVYAVGDGNHSLATAKACYEKLKKNHRWEQDVYKRQASGIPVIIWKEAALASFIVENNLGFAVDKLSEINEKLSQISDEQYKICLLYTSILRRIT